MAISRRFRVYDEGVLLPGTALNLTGSGVSAAANPSTGRVDASIAAGAGSYPGTVFEATGGDDTAALQAILTGFEAAGGGELIIVGMCKVSGLTYRGGNLTIRGANGTGSVMPTATGAQSQGNCGFINTSASTTTLDFSTTGEGLPTGVKTAQSNLVCDLVFYASNMMTGGYAIRGGSSFSCSTIERCNIFGTTYGLAGGHKNGIYLGRGCQDTHINSVFIWYCGSGTGIELEAFETNGSGSGTGTTYYLRDCFVASCFYGLYYKHKDAVTATNCHFVYNLYNVYMKADTAVTYGYGANHVWSVFTGCTFDSGPVYIDNSTAYASGNRIGGVRFIGCCFQATNLQLVGVIEDVTVDACYFTSAGQVIVGADAKNVKIVNNTFFGISGSNAAIALASGAKNFEIIGNTITCDLHYGNAGTTAPVGISFGGSHDKFVVALNRIKGSTAAGVGYTHSGTHGGTTYVFANNIATD